MISFITVGVIVYSKFIIVNLVQAKFEEVIRSVLVFQITVGFPIAGTNTPGDSQALDVA